MEKYKQNCETMIYLLLLLLVSFVISNAIESDVGQEEASFFLSDAPSIVPSSTPSVVEALSSDTLQSAVLSDMPSTAPSDSPTVIAPLYYDMADNSKMPSDVPSAMPSMTPSKNVESSRNVLSSDFVMEYATSDGPSNMPSVEPSISATATEAIFKDMEGNLLPSDVPSSVPSNVPSDILFAENIASFVPSDMPSLAPSISPTASKQFVNAVEGNMMSSDMPSTMPSNPPPSDTPTDVAPSTVPTASKQLAYNEKANMMSSDMPSTMPSNTPTDVRFAKYTVSDMPSISPSVSPTTVKAVFRDMEGSMISSDMPSTMPSNEPTAIRFAKNAASFIPSDVPSFEPSSVPTIMQPLSDELSPSSMTRSDIPSMMPSIAPSSIDSNGFAEEAIVSDTPSLSPSYVPTSIKPHFGDAGESSSEFRNEIPSNLPSVSFQVFNIMETLYVPTRNANLMDKEAIITFETVCSEQFLPKYLPFILEGGYKDLTCDVIKQTLRLDGTTQNRNMQEISLLEILFGVSGSTDVPTEDMDEISDGVSKTFSSFRTKFIDELSLESDFFQMAANNETSVESITNDRQPKEESNNTPTTTNWTVVVGAAVGGAILSLAISMYAFRNKNILRRNAPASENVHLIDTKKKSNALDFLPHSESESEYPGRPFESILDESRIDLESDISLRSASLDEHSQATGSAIRNGTVKKSISNEPYEILSHPSDEQEGNKFSLIVKNLMGKTQSTQHIGEKGNEMGSSYTDHTLSKGSSDLKILAIASQKATGSHSMSSRNSFLSGLKFTKASNEGRITEGDKDSMNQSRTHSIKTRTLNTINNCDENKTEEEKDIDPHHDIESPQKPKKSLKRSSGLPPRSSEGTRLSFTKSSSMAATSDHDKTPRIGNNTKGSSPSLMSSQRNRSQSFCSLADEGLKSKCSI